MAFSVDISKRISVAGKSVSHQETISTPGLEALEETISAAKAGTLTTRTDANTGTLTMDSGGHGIATGDIIDIYWDGGARRDVKVGTVSGTSVPIDLGDGDNLPIATTVVSAAVVQIFTTMAFDGDDVKALAAGGEYARCQIRLRSTLSDETALNFGSSSPVAALTLPAHAQVSKVKIQVVTAFDGTAPTVAVGIAGTTAKYAATSVADLKTVGTYEVDLAANTAAPVATEAIILTYVADSSAVGAAIVTVYYHVEELAMDLAAGECYEWLSTGPFTNPVLGDNIDGIRATVADTAQSHIVRVLVPVDN